MPECLDNMPWRSLKGLGDMAPDFLKLGDFKNVRLTDGTMVQFRIIGFRHDVMQRLNDTRSSLSTTHDKNEKIMQNFAKLLCVD